MTSVIPTVQKLNRIFFSRTFNNFKRSLSISCKLRKNEGSSSRNLDHVPQIKDFINSNLQPTEHDLSEEVLPPYLANLKESNELKKNVYFETYGCQMNVNDTEYAWAILKKNGYKRIDDVNKADVILLVTCAIREKAESKIWSRLNVLRRLKRQGLSGYPKIGLLGCMAERLKKDIVEKQKAVDIIAGPDAYRDLPRLLLDCHENSTAINVMLSVDETYADIMPVRFNNVSKNAFVSIMRGCDNMCSYCIVPFTRGRERSRPISSIVDEVRQLSDQGIKQVTVLGQNVNSYRDLSEVQHSVSTNPTNLSEGFKTIYKTKYGGLRFADLLDKVSQVNPNMRIRFTSPHPKDFPDEVLQIINERDNICKQIHLPAQSGSTAMLQAMRRGHTREDYLKLVHHIREIIPNISLSTDMISGFCGETEEDHQLTLDLVNQVKYNYGFFFAYSMRKKTHAYHKLKDDVPQAVKMRRLNEVLDAFNSNVPQVQQRNIGETQLILVEGVTKRGLLFGRNDGNIKVVLSIGKNNIISGEEVHIGDYIAIKIFDFHKLSLFGEPLYKTSLQNFYSEKNKHDRLQSAI